MKPFDRLSGYLSALERRMRWLTLTRGAAAIAGAALILTILAVIAANQFAFSHGSVVGARVFLFLGLAFAIAAALIIPLIRLNRNRAARAAEATHPQFQERLLTFTERSQTHPSDPFLHLLAADALTVAEGAQPTSVVKTTHLFGFSSAAVVALGALLWIATLQSFLGYGAGLLWGSVPKGAHKAFYSISVTPGNKTVRKRSDQVISAQLMGFTSPKVQFFARYASASQWEGADMRVESGGSSYQFLIAGVPETLDYYIEAGGVRSPTYKLNVVDLPSVKKVATTLHYPAYLGLKDVTEDPGGDLRAVQGTVGEVFVTFDKPLSGGGEIILDDGTKIALAKGANDTWSAKVPVQKDGMYHVAAVEAGDDVRLSEDYFIEAMKDGPPEISITKPARDFRALPVEEVSVAVNAKDDFGLKNVDLHYSVNGNPEKVVPLLQNKGAKESNGSTVLSLEDFKVEPGDVVSFYATASDARNTSKTDIFFIEAQPYERNYTQSQQEGGAGGGGGDDANQQNQISQREKEIITATWNQQKGTGARGTEAENAAFLSSVQSKLRDQAASLAQRMKSRELDGAGDSFKSFVSDMEQAVNAMQPAADKLKGAKWQDALPSENKALQYLLRAEATFRDIQVSMGRQAGGGGGGGGMNASRDLEGLFDLELDTQKNQYESGNSSSSSSDRQQQQVDDAMQKLAELARRQQALAEQQKKNPQNASQQRYEQEMLRREAEQLRQQLQQLNQQAQNQLSRDGQQSQQQSQQGQQGQTGQQGQSGQQSGQMSQQGPQGGQSSDQQMQQRLSQMAQGGQQQNQQQQQNQRQQQGQDQRLRGANAQQLKKALDDLAQAEQSMRNAQQQGSAQSDAEARRAAESLSDAQHTLNGLRNQQSANQLEQIAQEAQQAADQQRQFEGDLRRAAMQGDMTRQQANSLADQHQKQAEQVKKIEQDMQNAVRDLMASQRDTSNKLRQTLGDLQQAEIPRDMQRDSDWIRRGMGEYAAMSEAQITAGLNELRDRTDKLRKEMGPGGDQQKTQQGDKALEDAFNNVQQLRQEVEARAAQLRNQNGQGQPGQQGQQRQQQQLSRNNQPGPQGQQQSNQQGQQSQQAGQQGQQGQQGGQQGQQSGQQGQQGGQQAGGQQGQQGQPGQQNGGNYGGDQYSPQGGPNYNGGGSRGDFRNQDIQQAYRNALDSLNRLQQQYRNDPNAQRDINNTIRNLRQFDPMALNNDPLLSERINSALGNIEQAEMELRRKIDQAGGDGSIRSPGSEPTPQGYGSAIEEYFRKLSKTGKQ